MEQALLWSLRQEEPECPRRGLLDTAVHRQIVMAVSLRHVNRWRAARGLKRRPGRPGQADGYQPVSPGADVVRVTPQGPCVGVQVFAQWLDHQKAFGSVVAQLTQAVEAHKQTHPDDDFALWHHRESTVSHRFQALVFAPLLGLDHLRACDTRAHALTTLMGRGDHSATLSQFLGPLERVDAAESLMAALGADRAGPILSVAGPRIASGSRRSMHQGKSTMLGRIMAGSQGVLAQDDPGHAVFVASSPPDIPVAHVMVASCRPVAEATGSALVVIDRAVKAVARARAFDDQDWGWLWRLDDHEPPGLGSCETTLMDTLEEGTSV